MVRAIAQPEIDPTFGDAGPNAFGVRQVALSHLGDGDSHLGGRLGVEPVEPPPVGAVALGVEMLADPARIFKVTYSLPLSGHHLVSANLSEHRVA